MKAMLLTAASVLVLSAGIASAAPAITKSAATVRAGPGTQYQVVGRLPPRVAVDVQGCNRGWCEVAWNGADGFVNAAVLAMAGGPGFVVASPGYNYDEEPDYGVYVAPGFYGPGYRFRHHQSHGGDWRNRPGRPTTAQPSGSQPGFANPIGRGNPAISQGAPRASAPVGLRSGGPAISAPAAPRVSMPAAAPPAAPAASSRAPN